MKNLVGKTINRILINEDDTILAFDTDQGIVAFETYGDCCSSTWFDTINGVEALLGQTVLTHEDMPDVKLPESRDQIGERHYIEEMENYGEKLTTIKGHVDIIYRNSSNGYYGGDIHALDMGQGTLDVSKYREITADWEA